MDRFTRLKAVSGWWMRRADAKRQFDAVRPRTGDGESKDPSTFGKSPLYGVMSSDPAEIPRSSTGSCDQAAPTKMARDFLLGRGYCYAAVTSGCRDSIWRLGGAMTDHAGRHVGRGRVT
jgi:hypothetical protein